MYGNFLDSRILEDFNINKQNNNYNNIQSRMDNYDNYKKAQFKADRLVLAEQEMYYDQLNSVNPGHFSTENMADCTKETINYHKRAEPFDHNSYLTDQIVNEHIKKNHMDWVKEVTPWAGTASMVGACEFSAGDYLDFQGLRRPRGVQQIDPWQITEIDEEQLIENKPFTI